MSTWKTPHLWRPGDVARNLTARVLNEISGDLLYLYDTLTAHIGATTTWIDVDSGVGFDNGWTNYDLVPPITFAPAAYIIEDNWVHLRGMVTGGGVGATNSTIFTLPSGYRPTHNIFIAVSAGGAFGEVGVQTDGDVVAISGANNYFDLSQIHFRVI